MRPCSKCFTNNWSFQKNENLIKATCSGCGSEVEFLAKTGDRRKIEKVGDLCRDCNIPVVFKESKMREKKLKKAYYYTGYLYCTSCKKGFYVDDYKIINKDVCERNIEASMELGREEKGLF